MTTNLWYKFQNMWRSSKYFYMNYLVSVLTRKNMSIMQKHYLSRLLYATNNPHIQIFHRRNSDHRWDSNPLMSEINRNVHLAKYEGCRATNEFIQHYEGMLVSKSIVDIWFCCLCGIIPSFGLYRPISNFEISHNFDVIIDHLNIVLRYPDKLFYLCIFQLAIIYKMFLMKIYLQHPIFLWICTADTYNIIILHAWSHK